MALHVADVLDFLRALPADSVDLLVTSPPYELARTYGLKNMVGGQAWVDWMVEVVRAASQAVKGLIAIVCEGQTRGYRYSCAPFLLMADLHRAGFNLRKPCVFKRDGIPGSGGPDWLNNRWEPIICVTRPRRLQWSNNIACGHKPIHRAGGEVSYRLLDGTRVSGKRMMNLTTSGSKNGDTTYRKKRSPIPDVANPGNIIDCGAVGGGRMGHATAHRNEAPFPLAIPEFFIRSFCLPAGTVCDPFLGSGTTAHAAKKWGRLFIGCDVRESQVELTKRRLLTVPTELFV